MKQMDDNIGSVLKKLEDMGQLDNTIVVFTTDNGAEAITFPDGGVTPFKGQKGEAWEGGYRAPLVVRWPGHIKPGTVQEPDLRGARLGAHAGRHRRRTQGQRAEEADRGGQVPRDRQDHARRLQPARLPRGQVRQVGARLLLLLLGLDAVGGPLQELEDVLHHVAARTGRLDHAARHRSTSPWSRTSSAIPSSRRSAIDQKSLAGPWAVRWRPRCTAFHVQLEHAADRPAALAEGARCRTRSSRRCRRRRPTT